MVMGLFNVVRRYPISTSRSRSCASYEPFVTLELKPSITQHRMSRPAGLQVQITSFEACKWIAADSMRPVALETVRSI